MRKNLLHQPLFRIAVPPVYGFMMYFLILLVMNSMYTISETMLTQELLVCVILAYLVSEGARFSTVMVEKRFDGELKKPVNMSVLFVANLVIGTGLAFLFTYLYFTAYLERTSIESFRTELLTLVWTFGISSGLYTLFYLSIYFLTNRNETQIRQEDLKRQNLEHQLEIFNNEINPDLLFQSLETLISLVHHDLDGAEDFVDRLSVVYRYILENRKRELVNLREEVRASENIFHLFKEKFPEQVNLEIMDLSCCGDRHMVPNSMPILLDCIMNSTIISKRQPLSITVSYDDQEDYLIVQHKENDKLSLAREVVRRREQLHEAYAYFTDRPVIQIKAYGDVFMKLPLLNINGS